MIDTKISEYFEINEGKPLLPKPFLNVSGI
jgi:hypothetical protein